MPHAFEQSKDEIARLVKHFAINREQYTAPGYKEAQAREEFIDPMFVALGWDVSNSQEAAPNYREVVVEDSLEIEGQKKAPDYAFHVGRERKFFAEAKKPGDIRKSVAGDAYQLRRYAWTAKLPLSLLTDFDELAVYESLVRPSLNDKASVARVNHLTFTEYPDRWREVWDVFSHEAVWGGSFDKYAVTAKGKRGTSTVDVEFLKEIEGWREALAHNLALRNPHLTVDELCDSVQRTIDRIIFLRMAEDRGIEEYASMQRLIEKEGIYPQLLELFHHADKRYNSGLFDFSKSGDTLTPTLNLDDKTIKSVLTDLYFPQSPYEFSVLPVEILGNVYEQFLGKVIRLTLGHQAKVEEKPEVKKAGGVYYTPAYIVDYIVKNTVGTLVEGRSPEQLEGFRVLDPACGSGSFLLGAYQFLLDYYLRWYAANSPEKYKKAVYLLPGAGANSADWHLTSAEKRRILTEHIFGVDIDRQAVEVTKLSLLLKVLETDTGITLTQQLTLLPGEAQERALPNLDQNIKCGNSLIGTDYFSRQIMPDNDELRRVNPFDWKQGFPEAIRAGGFDCVIGNPPYVVLTSDLFSLATLNYLGSYRVAEYKTDLFHLFIQKGIDILKTQGLLGYIVPNTWFTLQFTRSLREYVLRNTEITELVVFAHRVFQDADVHTGLIVLQKKSPEKNHKVLVKILPSEFRADMLYRDEGSRISQVDWLTDEEFRFETRQSGKSGKLARRIVQTYPELEDVARASLGIQAYNSSKHTPEQIKKRVFHSDRKLSKEYLPELAGSDISRYLLDRKKGQWIKYGPWLHDYRTMDWLTGPRILVREIAGKEPYRIHACYTEKTYCNYKTILNVNPSLKTDFSMKYLLGILNSRLLSFLYPMISNKMIAQSFPRLSVGDVKRLPIRPINFSDPADKERHDKMVTLVEQMLQLHQQRGAAKDSAEQERLQRLIDSTDAQVDALVYELYGLTAEEIAVVEATNK